jgi:hypothetical protein
MTSGKPKQLELSEILIRNNGLADEIRKVTSSQSRKIKYDLNNSQPDSVINGLVFRIFSISLDIICHPMLMSNFYFALTFRPALESYLYLRYLDEKGDLSEYQSFMDYGIGQENLYKLNIEKLMDSGFLEEDEKTRAYVRGTTSIDNRDEYIKIQLKTWKDVYKICTELGMKEQHSLYYQPLSLDVHGTWSSLEKNNLDLCKEPLHAFHYKPAYPQRYMQMDNMRNAIQLLNNTYDYWIDHYGLKDDLEPVMLRYYETVSGKQ